MTSFLQGLAQANWPIRLVSTKATVCLSEFGREFWAGETKKKSENFGRSGKDGCGGGGGSIHPHNTHTLDPAPTPKITKKIWNLAHTPASSLKNDDDSQENICDKVVRNTFTNVVCRRDVQYGQKTCNTFQLQEWE